MNPALGLVSLAWALSCFILSSKAKPNDVSQCCKCSNLFPDKVPPGTKPQVMPSPFKIEVKEGQYDVLNEIHVDLVATQGRTFRSFLLAAYPIPYQDGKSEPVGQLTLLTKDFAVGEEKCSLNGGGSRGFALVSRDEKPKSNLKFVWTSNSRVGHVEFRATFVEDNYRYWVAEKSRILPQVGSSRPLPKAFYHSIPPISTKDCGITKGCFREPADCVEPQCTYLVTWTTNQENIEFEMGALSDGAADRYMGVGLSDDTYMGEDLVMTCAHSSATQTTEVYLGYNQKGEKKHIPLPKYKRDRTKYNVPSEYTFIEKEEGSYENGRLRCRFTIKRDLERFNSVLKTLRGDPQHFLLAHGYAKHGAPGRHGLDVLELPMASSKKIDLGSYGDHNDRASYPLAKAHGILMIIAWVLFASIGLLLTKYYKTMWPNSRVYDSYRYWFLGHVNCMAMVFIITIIGFILIFVEAGGYSQAPDLPQKAHPILGIIIFCCIIINPILALLRPSEDSKCCRPVFNWFHWAFGTIANVLAIPQIFIGMDFGKVMVPWWATWILVIWVIFHIVVELSLEIHQCCTYKKNKERKKKWEQLKREYPKQHHPEPEPAGRRFKRFMLFLHVSFTILITLIMVIIIAVS